MLEQPLRAVGDAVLVSFDDFIFNCVKASLCSRTTLCRVTTLINLFWIIAAKSISRNKVTHRTIIVRSRVDTRLTKHFVLSYCFICVLSSFFLISFQ